MTKRISTRKAEARERAAERITVILADPDTPVFLYDVLTDMLMDMSNRSNVDIFTPEVARVALPLIFAYTDKEKLRQSNGRLDSPALKKADEKGRAKEEAEKEFPALIDDRDDSEDSAEVC